MASQTPYIKDDQGTFIPASQRPDGTWRKPRRVKDGYVPQEEVPLYESKGKQFVKNKPAYPVGMSAEYVAAHKAKKELETSKSNPIPGLVIQTETKKKKKKGKSKGVAAVTEDLAKTTLSDQAPSEKKQQTTNEKPKTQNEKPKTPNEKPKSQNEKPKVNDPPAEAANKQTSTTDPLKRLKNLRKKIREIESLDKKIKSGEIKNPDKEMLEKVSRKAEIQQEIKQLEANQ
ncbi:hypothetical protein TSAR_006654 [Trichomalopsis sarcophagae]|uniref:Partner of Y14 and mago n=1 Tax=Trichomalopsis sarcophagae TaxID=543379 RepID=A0A232EWZ9_9HYME|nr:hypothetical protein TSAR_006654 [Trichomalopsis sarcophagae]